MESKTFICSEHERDVVPVARAGQKSALGNYISPADYDKAVIDRFPGCMRGEYRNLYNCYKGRKLQKLSTTKIKIDIEAIKIN